MRKITWECRKISDFEVEIILWSDAPFRFIENYGSQKNYYLRHMEEHVMI